ncbi:ATP-binding protein [Methylotetracoccus oryzae]|uniref:ATP-binding protein n=1 Tax=Methylotetracoccus oryzae TaxID=1919059 RepID=UPI001117D7E6|nr:ATP-binding protein [Methylotetracoccus oryzae]
MTENAREIKRQAHAMDSSMEGMAILNGETYIYMNPAHAHMYGFEVDELIGQSWRQLYDSDETTRIEREIFPVLAELQHWTGEVKGRLKDGRYRDVELNLTIIPTGELVCACRDITERKRAEADLSRKNALLMAIRDIQSRFMVGDQRHEVFPQLLSAALRFSESELGFVGEVLRDEHDQPYLHTQALSNVAWNDESRDLYRQHAARGLALRKLDSLFGHVLVTGQPIIANDPASDPRRGGLPPGHPGLRCFMGLPIYSGGQLVGMVGVANRPGGYDERLIEFLEPLLSSYGSIMVARQVDQRRRQAEKELELSRDELRVTNIELQKASRLKDEFLASMSHELRTPLTAILGLTEVLSAEAAPALNDTQLRYLATIEESGHHLHDLINDILDLAKVAAGQVELQADWCCLQDLCSSSIAMVLTEAKRKEIQIRQAIDTPDLVFLADARRVKQVLVNLLSNAVKFTPKQGSVGLEVRSCAADEALRVVVWDTGIGIAPEHFDRLFAPFTQVDARLSRQYGGTGLGLSLVAKLVELHGGSVSVQSRVGEGSRFEVTLPLTRLSDASNHAPTPPTPQLGVTRPQSLLIAEDNDILRGLLEDYLGARGFRVVSAVNGQEAVELNRTAHPQLILMDIQMPTMDGLEAIRRIRREEAQTSSRRPIIALTALAMPGDEERCRQAGADDYIIKPCSLARLFEIVSRRLDI